MQIRTQIDTHETLIKYTLEGCDTPFWCTRLEWEIYEMELQLHQKYGIPVDEIRDLMEKVRDLCNEDSRETD